MAQTRDWQEMIKMYARIDLGLRLEDQKPGGRLLPSKIQESMRLQISLTSPAELDAEVLHWLQVAYEQNC